MSKFDTCIKKIRDVNESIRDGDIEHMAREMQRRIRKLGDEDFFKTAEDSVRDAADGYKKEVLEGLNLDKYQRIRNFLARKKIETFITNNFPDRPWVGFEAQMVGINSSKRGTRGSAAAAQNALNTKYVGRLEGDLLKDDLMKQFIDGAIDREVAQELWAITDPSATVGVSGNKDAMKIAAIVNKHQEVARNDANKAGAWVKKLPGYIVRQTHDMYRIRSAGIDTWKAEIRTKLDWKRIEREWDDPKGGLEFDQDRFLDGIYEGLSTGIHIKNFDADTSGSPFKGFRNQAKKLSSDRTLHFSSADDWFDYNLKFSLGNIREAVYFGLERSANSIGLMQTWGPNPAANFDFMFNKMVKKAKGDTKIKLNDSRKKLDNRMAELNGDTRVPANAMAAKWSAVVRSIEGMAKLGGAVISAVTDVPFLASEMKYQGGSLFSGYADALRGFTTSIKKGERAEIFRMIGITLDGHRADVISRFDAQDDVPGRLAKAQGRFFKWNLLTPWTDRMRISATLGMSARLAMNADKGWSKIDPDLQRTLGLFDIDEADWNVMRKHMVREAEGEKFMVTEGLQDISSKELGAAIGSKDSRKIARFRDALENKLFSYFTDRVEHAVIRPDQRTNAILRQGTRPGTVDGEFLRFITQFKGFPTAVVQKVVGRELFGKGATSIGEAMKSGNGEMAGLMSVIVQSTITGYLAMSIKDMVKGRGPRDPTSVDTWQKAALQGGGFGLYGDFLLGEVRNTYGGNALSNFLGPTFDAGADVLDLFGRLKDGDPVAGASLRTLINNTPFVNLFYTKMAMDYLLIYQIQESLNPGYLKRMQRKIERENKQSFIVSPREFVR